MKTTVKLTTTKSITVKPSPRNSGGVVMGFHDYPFWLADVELTQDQAGALIFGIEQAAEAARIAQERESRG